MLQSPTMKMHRLHLLCLCELGENGIGLQRRKSMNCDTHHELLKLIVDMANQDWTDDAGQHPTYAAIKRHDSKLTVEEILFHCGLDTRPGQRPDRTMMTLNCRWMNQSINILNCHCPSSKNQSGIKTREAPCCPTYSTLLASYHSISEAALQSLPLGSWATT